MEQTVKNCTETNIKLDKWILKLPPQKEEYHKYSSFFEQNSG